MAMFMMDPPLLAQRKSAGVYSLIAAVLVTAGSVLGWRMLDVAAHNHGGDGHSHSSHSHGGPSAQRANAPSASSSAVSREISIDMLDQMRFSPSTLEVGQGETIRFVVKNLGKLRHEWVIGNEQELRAHAHEMKQSKAGSHQHDMANAISLDGGEQGVLTWTFSEAGTLAMACFEPGHYEAGMRGVIHVLAKK
jgi:uncharacterized cupredoxin-like copper-binding protein